jgi:primosomal protein N''
MTRIFPPAIATIVALTLFSPALAQQTKQTHADETVAQVPILTDFHEVIFKVWHTAWPDKNLAMLTELLPEIRHFSDSLGKVQLPGILRDKQKAWKLNTAKLQEIVSEYAGATSPVDSQKLLDAAERLHAQYEALVRMTRPVLEEMDAFHQVLYMLYHHYLPGKNQEKLTSSVKELKERMTALNKATLPERLTKREAAFNAARSSLAHSVEALDASMAEDNLEEFASKVETMHTNYQTLEKVFE